MKIVVNTRSLIKDKLEGIGRFSYETLQRVVKAMPQHEFVFLFDRPYSNEFVFASNVTPIVLGPRARHPFLFYYWYNYVVTRFLKRTKADLFLSMDGMLSLKTNTKQIAVIHDLNFVHFPQYLPKLLCKYYQNNFPKFAKKANRIVTVSEYSKNDIIKNYHIEQSKIDVSCNAASDCFKVLSENEKERVRKQYTEGAAYFVYIGSLNPRKNIKGLIQGFEEFKKYDTCNVKLVIVGEGLWKKNSEISLDSNDVIFTGRLSDSETAKVLGASLALCYVSFFEGFGIPLLEAMNAGVPVITSNTTSMPEVAGEAALLVDPSSLLEISDAMKRISSDKELRDDLIKKGIEREKQFTWGKAANVLIESIEKCIG